MATLYEYNETENSFGLNIGGLLSWECMTFTPSIKHTITSVKLKVSRIGSPGTFTVSIRATSGGEPTGGDLCIGTINGNTFIESYDSGEWYEITLGDGYILNANTKYTIVVRALNGSSGNIVRWRDNAGNIYDNGNSGISTDGGITWGMNNNDKAFEDWGESIITKKKSIYTIF